PRRAAYVPHAHYRAGPARLRDATVTAVRIREPGPVRMAAAIAFQTLGPVGLADAAGRELHALLAQPRRLALLAYLAVAAPPGLHRRDPILTLFWPALDQQHARAALRPALRVSPGSLRAV